MHNDANQRSFSTIVADIKDELKQLIDTRIAMFREEMREKTARLKVAAPLGVIGLILLGTGYVLITLSFVAALAAIFSPNPYRWFFGFGIVGALWAILGAVLAYLAKREFEVKALAPQRTIEVLKGDKVWLEREVKKAA